MGAEYDELDPEVKAQITQTVAELPPLTDAQLDALCEVLVRIRLRQAAER